MLLTPSMPRPRSLDHAAGIHQVLVTHCLYDEGLFRAAGFGPRAGSTSDALALRFASEYPAYELPAGLASDGLDPASAPRRLALVRIPGGRSALIHSVHLPDDGRGRANNFLSHVLIGPSFVPADALRTWASGDWRTRWDEEGTSLPVLRELPRSGPVGDVAVTSFLKSTSARADDDLATTHFPSRLGRDPARRRELVRLALRGCCLALQARPGAPRSRFYLRAEPGLAALMLYAVARLAPEGLAAQLTFSTYEDAHHALRLYRHAAVVNTYTPDATKELDDDLFTARGFALDTFTQRHSPELRGEGEPAVEQWIDLAGEGEWSRIDKVHQLLGPNCTSLVSLRDALQAARVSERLASGEALPEDLFALRRSPLGDSILHQHRDQVWRVVRDGGAGDERLRTEFSGLLRERRAELEENVAAALRTRPPGDWRPAWQLLLAVLRHEPAYCAFSPGDGGEGTVRGLRETIQRLLPEPPFHLETRFGLLEELKQLPLSPADQRSLLPQLLGGCTVEELGRFAESDLPRTWYAHALCHGALRPETREFAVAALHDGDDVLVQALWEHFQHLTDEEQRRAILGQLFPPNEPAAAVFLSRLLRSGCTLRAETLEWLLDELKVWRKHWAVFWGRDDHLGHLLEMLRGLGVAAAPSWEKLWGQIDEEALLPGNSYQQLLLMNLAAVLDRPGPTLPPAVVQAINDWVILREHFEKASVVPEGKRRALIDACNRRRLDPIGPLGTYFERFVAPHGARTEVVEDFVGFFHSFYLAGGEHQHYSSRLIGWLRVVSQASEDESIAKLQRHYLERHVPMEFRWQLANETHRAGLLLASVFEAVPKPTGEAEIDAIDDKTRMALDDELFQLTGTRPAVVEAPVMLQTMVWRGPWLLAALAIGLACLVLAGLYPGNPESRARALVFVPGLLLLVDAIAQQSAGLAVRALRTGAKRVSGIRQDLRGEAIRGASLGLAGGGLLAAAALAWTGSWSLAACLTITTVAASAWAAAAGLFVPALLRVLPARPWMAAGPVARVLAGVVASWVYFLLARFILA
jgi:hypothetical protein